METICGVHSGAVSALKFRCDLASTKRVTVDFLISLALEDQPL